MERLRSGDRERERDRDRERDEEEEADEEEAGGGGGLAAIDKRGCKQTCQPSTRRGRRRVLQLTCFAFQLATVLDRDQLEGPVLGIDWHLADGDNRLESLDDAAQHDVLALQVRTRTQGYEELARVCAGNVQASSEQDVLTCQRTLQLFERSLFPLVGHAQQTLGVDLAREVLVTAPRSEKKVRIRILHRQEQQVGFLLLEAGAVD